MHPSAAISPEAHHRLRRTDYGHLRIEDVFTNIFGPAPLPPVVETQVCLMLIDAVGRMIAARAAPEEQFGKPESDPFHYPGRIR